MNYNIEKNKPDKNMTRKRGNNRLPGSISTTEKKIDASERRLKDGGFIAWPEEHVSKKEAADNDIRIGRTKIGGYIAFPKD